MPNRFINFNGDLLDAETPVVTASNRSLRYGDGLFESMRWEKGTLPLGGFHFDRLFRGLGILQMECAAGFTAAYLSTQVRNLCEKNGQESARVRLNVFREDSPTLSPVNNRPRFIIETADLPARDPEPMRATVYTEEKKSNGILSNLKVNNHLLYIMAARYAAQNGFDESLILNTEGRFCEASSSNLFLISGKKIITPALSEGCVAGVMRRRLLDLLPGLGYTVLETTVPKEMADDIEEAFLTNAIRGVRPLGRIGDKKFPQKKTLELISQLAAFPF
jgi:branched-chain amino acid aminotransferase